MYGTRQHKQLTAQANDLGFLHVSVLLALPFSVLTSCDL